MQLDPNNGYSRRKLNLPVVANELQDTFYSNGIKRNVVHVRLNSTGLLLQKRTVPAGNFSKNHQVKISDIIGGRCVRLQRSARFNSTTGCVCTPNAEENDTSQAEDAYLYVFAYILKKNLRNCIRRERTIITLRFRSFDSHEDNLREAEIWYKTLKMHRNNYLMQDNPVSFANFPIRRLLILLNPKSGTGNAKELFREQVVPVLNEAEVLYDMYITKDSKYAFEFIQSRDLSAWSGIAAVGGDGLFHEILNGLLKRSDWKKVVENVSIGIVPCGSGNGLARSIAYCFNTNLQENTNFFPFVIHLKNGHKTSVEGCKSRILGIIQDGQAASEPFDPKPILGAALTIVNGFSATMDLVEIKMGREILYSFLSVGWGLISDIDIESERLRPLGYQRFTIWTLHRLLNLRTYRGRISYIPKTENNSDSGPLSKVATISSSSLQNKWSCNLHTSTLTKNYESNDHISVADFEDLISIETLPDQSFRSQCGSWLSTNSRKSAYYSVAESVYHSIPDISEYNDGNSEKVIYGKENLHKTCMDKKTTTNPLHCSEKWVVEDGEFVMIHAAYQTHLGRDCHFAPHSSLNDGTIHLVIIHGGISRSQLFTFLMNMSSGTHLPTENTDYIKFVRVEAFNLDPHENNGILTVDGERVKNGPLQARIIPGAINVMIPKNTN